MINCKLFRFSNTIPTFKTRLSPGSLFARYLSTQNEPAPKASQLQSYVNPLRKPDFFNVHELVSIKDMFNARVHFGHKDDTLDVKMSSYVFGKRLGHLIFDLEQTAELLRDALNFAAHIAYRGGIILFISANHQHCHAIERAAVDICEYSHTRNWELGTLTNQESKFKTTIRCPDLLIFLNTLNNVLMQHIAVKEAAKLNIPTIGIVDSNCDPSLITYPVPGNDDSLVAIEYYLRLFTEAIRRGKSQRKIELELEESERES